FSLTHTHTHSLTHSLTHSHTLIYTPTQVIPRFFKVKKTYTQRTVDQYQWQRKENSHIKSISYFSLLQMNRRTHTHRHTQTHTHTHTQTHRHKHTHTHST